MPFFSKVFKGGSSGSKDAGARRVAKDSAAFRPQPPKPRWDDAWLRTSIEPEEVQELLRGCTQEIKARALEVPFLILPFRPASDPSAAKAFIRNFFGDGREPEKQPTGQALIQELRMVEPLVLCAVCKWCWSRLPGGVVTWEAYELFTIGEKDSNQARDAFNTFIPISVGSSARSDIIFDFFELLAATAAHGKINGLGGRKLSRLAGWWAFEQADTSNGFESGYKNWLKAADATSHLFFAYLRSLAPNTSQERSGVTMLPRALEALLDATEYPPDHRSNLQSYSSKVVMIVENVSPTPFALLSRARDFRYRDEDEVLQRFSDFEDPEDALTDECRRVLRSISSSNDTSSAKMSTSLKDPSWSRFEDIGFSSLTEEADEMAQYDAPTVGLAGLGGLRSAPQSRVDLGRPTTPSWADFLSTGFVDEKQSTPAVLLPPDKILPPISTRAHSSRSQRRMMDDTASLEPGELANITQFQLDDAFWWAWITSLSGEEPSARKAAFGRCALIETRILGSSWLVMEELLRGAAPEPVVGAYVAEKKSRFTFSKKLSRSKTSAKGAIMSKGPIASTASRTTQRSVSAQQSPSQTKIAPDQQARIQAAAAALQEKHKADELSPTARRGRTGEGSHQKTQSVATLQPIIAKEAAPALRWASSYDKTAIRAQYLGNEFAGRGSAVDVKEVLESDDTVARSAQTPVPGQEPANGAAGVAGTTSSDKKDGTGAAVPPESAKAMPADTSVNRKPNSGAANGPQAAKFFASQMPTTAQPEKTQKPLPAKPSQPSSITPSALSTKQNEAAAAAAQRALSQPPVPPKQEANGIVKTQSTKVDSTLAPKNQSTVSVALGASRDGAYGKPPSTPDQSGQGAIEPSSSPESTRSDRNKLRKKNQQVSKGIKNMFGLKKSDDEPKAAPKPLRTQPSASTSVAAARAALEAKAKENQHTSPSPPATRVTTKRYSTAGKNAVVEEPGLSKTTTNDEARPESLNDRTPRSDAPEQVSVAPGADRPISMAESSVVDPDEEKRAREAFGAFDQGAEESSTPMQVQAPVATVLASIPPPNPQAGGQAPKPAANMPQETSATPAEVAPVQADAGSEVDEAVPDVSDRWAQIRKNAAERAARMSEEHSAARTERTDDDGETSGDETIESRVARIKARVAELTGNMDTAASRA